jgi:peptide/nickel transport system ATP-binding protein
MPHRERLKLRGTSMSMVFQDPMSSLNPVFTIADQMGTILKYADRRLGRVRSGRERHGARPRGAAQVRMREPERVAAILPDHAVGRHAPARADRHGAALSEPRLLIADEPGTALDVTTQAQILKLLKDLVEARGLALMMITHNLGVVRETSSYVYVMNKGVVVEHRPDRRAVRRAAGRLHPGPDRRGAAAHRRHPLRKREAIP